MAEQGKKVLLADDEADVHAFVEAALEDDVPQIIHAYDGQAALEMAAGEKPDLVILDVQMPEKNGFEVFAELRKGEQTKTIPVIMLTAVSERTGIPFSARDMGDYYGSEPDAYIDKPIEPGKLRETVRNLLGIG